MTFRAVVASLKNRPYHGTNASSPILEDFPSGLIRGRRANLEGTPSLARMLVGLPVVGQVLSNWMIDVEVRVAERQGQVAVAVKIRTTLPQQAGEGLPAR